MRNPVDTETVVTFQWPKNIERKLGGNLSVCLKSINRKTARVIPMPFPVLERNCTTPMQALSKTSSPAERFKLLTIRFVPSEKGFAFRNHLYMIFAVPVREKPNRRRKGREIRFVGLPFAQIERWLAHQPRINYWSCYSNDISGSD
uniref:Uncharacterized protein n=1 Tax=Romanomermis culicivorax TaxID=13658 RepID=A0A915IWX7_ROMCU